MVPRKSEKRNKKPTRMDWPSAPLVGVFNSGSWVMCRYGDWGLFREINKQLKERGLGKISRKNRVGDFWKVVS